MDRVTAVTESLPYSPEAVKSVVPSEAGVPAYCIPPKP